MNVEELKQSEVIRERASVGDSSFGEFVEAMGVEGEFEAVAILEDEGGEGAREGEGETGDGEEGGVEGESGDEGGEVFLGEV